MQCADAGPQASPAPPWPSEIHILLPWQQVPQREFPFCDKEWLSRARKKPKSHQGHVIKDPHGRLRVWDHPTTAVEVFLNKCEYIQHTLSPPSSLPAETSQARTRPEKRTPLPPLPPCFVGAGVRTKPPTWREILRSSRRQNFTSGKKRTSPGHYFWLRFVQPF